MTEHSTLLKAFVHSALWQQPAPTRIVYITMVALANKRTGQLECTILSLSQLANVARRYVTEALRCLSSPDPKEEDQDNKGIKIARTPRGWLILDYEKAKRVFTQGERRAHYRRKVREYRHRKKYGLITPKDPKLVSEEEEKIRSYYLPTSPQARRLSLLMHRKLDTCWTPQEITAFTEIWRIEDEDLLFLEEYYKFWRHHGPRRNGSLAIKTSLLSLLRNYDHEVAKAKQFIPRFRIEDKIKGVNGRRVSVKSDVVPTETVPSEAPHQPLLSQDSPVDS